ncbi:hypothetical protein EAG_10767 [Camponotus floridanus]|uniref:Uncharacterized protein n=1 Tax=Camponotus floridanus TaxID=104421 RepID=E2AFI9_CAMFO|nr:hypothetical protein EAG_10767 [Camponotus floridanus]
MKWECSGKKRGSNDRYMSQTERTSRIVPASRRNPRQDIALRKTFFDPPSKFGGMSLRRRRFSYANKQTSNIPIGPRRSFTTPICGTVNRDRYSEPALPATWETKVYSLSIRRVKLSIRKRVDLRPTCIRGSDVRVDAPPDIVQRNNLPNNPIDFEAGSEDEEDQEDRGVIAGFSFRKKIIKRNLHGNWNCSRIILATEENELLQKKEFTSRRETAINNVVGEDRIRRMVSLSIINQTKVLVFKKEMKYYRYRVQHDAKYHRFLITRRMRWGKNRRLRIWRLRPESLTKANNSDSCRKQKEAGISRTLSFKYNTKAENKETSNDTSFSFSTYECCNMPLRTILEDTFLDASLIQVANTSEYYRSSHVPHDQPSFTFFDIHEIINREATKPVTVLLIGRRLETGIYSGIWKAHLAGDLAHKSPSRWEVQSDPEDDPAAPVRKSRAKHLLDKRKSKSRARALHSSQSDHLQICNGAGGWHDVIFPPLRGTKSLGRLDGLKEAHIFTTTASRQVCIPYCNNLTSKRRIFTVEQICDSCTHSCQSPPQLLFIAIERRTDRAEKMLIICQIMLCSNYVRNLGCGHILNEKFRNLGCGHILNENELSCLLLSSSRYLNVNNTMSEQEFRDESRRASRCDFRASVLLAISLICDIYIPLWG